MACLLAAPVKPTARLMLINSRKGRGLMRLCMVGIGVPYCAILATDQANRERLGPGLLQFLRLVRWLSYRLTSKVG